MSRTRPRRVAWTAAAVAAAMAASLGGGVPAGAEPLPSEMLFEWVAGTPKTLLNGEAAQAQFWLNANQQDGSGDPVPVNVEFHVAKGGFTEVPQECGEGSRLDESKTTLTCALGEQPGGTAASFAVPVRASGVDGDEIVVDAELNGTKTVLRPIEITTVTGVDVWFDSAGSYANIGGLGTNPPLSATWAHPFMIAVPIGAANLEPQLEFDMTVTDGEGVPATSVLGEPRMLREVPAAHVRYPSRLARSCKPTNPGMNMEFDKTGSGKWHVTVTGFNTDPALAFSRTMDGSKVDADRVWLDSGCIGLGVDGKKVFGPDSNVWTYEVALSNVKATHVSGAPAQDLATFKKVEDWQLTYGYIRSAFGRGAFTFDTLGGSAENANLGVGVNNDGRALAVPGEELSVNLVSGLDHLTDDPRGSAYCVMADPGKTQFQKDRLRAGYAGWDFELAYSTSRIGRPGETHCGDLQFSTAQPGDWSKVTAVKITGKPSRLSAAKPVSKGLNETSSIISGMLRVNPSLKAGTTIRHDASFFDGQKWVRPSEGARVNAERGTTLLSDRAVVVPSRVTASKRCSPATVAPGKTTTCTVTALVAGNPATVSVTDTLPKGWTVTEGAAPVDGQLRWSAKVGKNESKSWVYTVQAPQRAGAFTNEAVATIPVELPEQKPFASSKARQILTVETTGLTHLVKRVEAAEFAINAENTWRLELSNRAAVPSRWSILDVLPFNGDGRGSSFAGGYRIDEVLAPGARVYYTDRDPAGIDPKPEANDVSTWSTEKPERVTAIWIVGDEKLGSGESASATIVWTTHGNRGEDRYVNRAVAQLPETTILQMIRAEDTTTAKPVSPLQIDKTLVGQGQVAPGAEVEYEVTVLNPDEQAVNDVLVEEFGSSQLEIVGFREVEQGDADGASWKVGTLAGGQQARAVLVARVKEDADFSKPIVNRVQVSSPDWPGPGPDGDCVPNRDVHGDTDQCDIEEFSEDSELKIDKQQVSVADGLVTWRVEATNTGPDAASAVVVKDLGGENTDEVQIREVSKGEQRDGTWQVGVLEPGEVVWATVTGRVVDAAKETRNRATVENPRHPVGEACEPNEGLDADTDQCDVTVTPGTPPAAPAGPAAPSGGAASGGGVSAGEVPGLDGTAKAWLAGAAAVLLGGAGGALMWRGRRRSAAVEDAREDRAS